MSIYMSIYIRVNWRIMSEGETLSLNAVIVKRRFRFPLLHSQIQNNTLFSNMMTSRDQPEESSWKQPSRPRYQWSVSSQKIISKHNQLLPARVWLLIEVITLKIGKIEKQKGLIGHCAGFVRTKLQRSNTNVLCCGNILLLKENHFRR